MPPNHAQMIQRREDAVRAADTKQLSWLKRAGVVVPSGIPKVAASAQIDEALVQQAA